MPASGPSSSQDVGRDGGQSSASKCIGEDVDDISWIENTRQVTLDKINRGPLGKIAPLIETFSTCYTPDTHLRMVTVGISHYCEKTRWALDLSGLPYYEDAHPPGLSALQTTTLDPNVSATPIVRMTNGTVVKDSTTINKIVCPQLYPDDKDKAQGEYIGLVMYILYTILHVYIIEAVEK